MTFFNKKEEVIDIELTSYGKSMLSIGKFKPVYYAFFDDDVLYDAANSAGVLESQNDIEGRIQENTPNLKAQPLFTGLETTVNFLVAMDRLRMGTSGAEEEGAIFPPTVENDFSLIEPLGTMEIGGEDSPSWNIQVLQGELSGAINYLTSSAANGRNSEVRRIPQLDFEMKYEIAVGDGRETSPATGPSPVLISEIYNDGTYMYLPKGEPEIILSVDEKNCSSDTEYDIEVFEIVDFGNSDILIPLNFPMPTPEVVDDLLLSPEERMALYRTPGHPTADMVGYYFNLDADLEIPEEKICELIAYLRTRDVDVDDIPYDCPEVLPVNRFDIYDTDATGGEEC
tara:strand:+ start:20837 stop:21859 length:1023 start_codon:yes stop_codon:yes gene_type:complete